VLLIAFGPAVSILVGSRSLEGFRDGLILYLLGLIPWLGFVLALMLKRGDPSTGEVGGTVVGVDAINGVYLPSPFHQAVHTTDYFGRLANVLGEARTADEAQAALRTVGQELAHQSASDRSTPGSC
jgi:hypothetical protein